MTNISALKPALLTRVRPIEDTANYIKFLLYGPPGAGKTYFAGSSPNPIVIDFERSAETYRHVAHLKETPVFIPNSFEETFQLCREVVQAKSYETIVIDTISRLQVEQLNEYMEVETQNGKKRSKYLSLWGDYRVSTNLLDEFFVFLQKAPIHVILVAHSAEDIDQETGKITRIKPNLTPALNKALIGLINVVGYLDTTTNIKGELTRKLTINPTPTIVAKNRLNIQEISITNPQFKEIFK